MFMSFSVLLNLKYKLIKRNHPAEICVVCADNLSCVLFSSVVFFRRQRLDGFGG